MRILIIGAGPVGSYSASLLAKQHDVSIIEEHSTIGEPVHCTGIVTPEIFKFIPKNSKFILNKINDVRIIAPNSSALSLHFKQPDIILDRPAFDKYFFSLACKASAHTYLKHRFISAEDGSAKIKDLSTGKIKTLKFDNLIGADGPSSIVGKSAGLTISRKFMLGVQAVVKIKNNNVLDFYPLKKGFGWAVPVDKNTMRVGVACEQNASSFFSALLKKYPGRIIEKQGGLIPIYDPKAKFCKDNVFLAGDAAGFVKATTGGGIIPGLGSAEALSKCSLNQKNYCFEIKKFIKPELKLNLFLRNAMNLFSEADWNNIVKALDHGSAKKSFENINRDNLKKLATSIAIKKPILAKYALKIIF